MRYAILAMAGLLAMGCSDYGFTQKEPPNASPNTKPLDGQTQADRIVQITNPEVDVLFLVDNSCSMGNKQQKLANAFPEFMQYFVGSGLDYHIGAISTDMSSSGSPNPQNTRGRLRPHAASGVKWLDPDTPNPVAVFSNIALMGEGGHWDERGRQPVYMALEHERYGWNDGFQRDNASLHIIAISDEDDYACHEWNAGACANPNDPFGPPTISRAEFISFLQTLKPNADLTFNSIVNNPQTPTPWGEDDGHEYIAYTQAIGGILWDIQRDDWADILDALGLQALGLRREFFLSRLPVPGSIEVQVVEDGATFRFEEETDWTYDRSRNSITFLEFVPQPMSEVLIDYDVLAAHQEG